MGKSATRIWLASVALCALLAAGCGSGATPPSPDIDPVDRLGRWDGTTFVPVAPASIAGGHVYVLVHGWAAGFKEAVDGYPGPGPLLGWYPEAVDGRGRRFTEIWLAPMAAALSAADPGAEVVIFSWLDRSATDAQPLAARISESRTVASGETLGRALNRAVAPAFGQAGGMLHLLGHSHGAKVATIGALALPAPPAHLTLFDSVDTVVPATAGADNDLVPYLRRLSIGREPGRTFVDNYYSEFGRAYGNEPGLEAIVDTSLVPGGLSRVEMQDRHLYPPRWYTAAARAPATGVGPQWSPLLGRAYESLGGYYVTAAPGDPDLELTLVAGRRPPPPTLWSFIRHWAVELLAATMILVCAAGLIAVAISRLAARARRRRRR